MIHYPWPDFASPSAMFNRTNGQSVRARLCAALGAYKTIQRQRSSVRMRAQQQAVRAVQDLLQNAAVAASVLAATSTGAEEDRRAVERALGKWRGSTVARGGRTARFP